MYHSHGSSNLLTLSMGAMLIANASANRISPSVVPEPWIAYCGPDLPTTPVVKAEIPRLRAFAIDNIVDTLENFKNLRASWDGPGSLAPAHAAVNAARSFIFSLPVASRLPDVSAGTDGEVNISWREPELFVDLSFYSAAGGSLYARTMDTVVKIPSGIVRFGDLPETVLGALVEI